MQGEVVSTLENKKGKSNTIISLVAILLIIGFVFGIFLSCGQLRTWYAMSTISTEDRQDIVECRSTAFKSLFCDEDWVIDEESFDSAYVTSNNSVVCIFKTTYRKMDDEEKKVDVYDAKVVPVSSDEEMFKKDIYGHSPLIHIIPTVFQNEYRTKLLCYLNCVIQYGSMTRLFW